MAKKSASKPKNKMAPKPRKKTPGVRVKRDRKFLVRLMQLEISPTSVDEALLAILLELQGQAQKHAELAFRYDAAVTALKAASYRSDKPEEWIGAARKAANL
jgi:hypothetical protein